MLDPIGVDSVVGQARCLLVLLKPLRLALGDVQRSHVIV